MLLIVVFLLFYYNFDYTTLAVEYKNLYEKLKQGPLQSLLNGSGINNIPKLNLITSNNTLSKANDCERGPVRINDLSVDGLTNTDCVRLCLSSDANLFRVNQNNLVTYESKMLEPGQYCKMGQLPECNPKTTISMITVNSIHCQSKFPNLFGGELGNKIIACNNNIINDPKNILWDFKENKPVSPWTTTILDENEIHDEDFRFKCKFFGLDNKLNAYISHPKNRFHPIRNYCAALITNAHDDVKTVFSDDGLSYKCDCGDPSVTNVQHINADILNSQCSSVKEEHKRLEKEKFRMTVPYRCFNINSPIEDVLHVPPCPDLIDGKKTQSSFVLEYTEDPRELIEHPEYSKFSDRNGIYVPETAMLIKS